MRSKEIKIDILDKYMFNSTLQVIKPWNTIGNILNSRLGKKLCTSFVTRKQEADEYFMSLLMRVSLGRGGYFNDFSC